MLALLRFPELVGLAQQRTSSITDPEMLNHIIGKLFVLQTAEEVEQYLKTLGKDETKN
jgi:hypothetical protein